MATIKIYSSREFGKLRTLEIGGEPWFVGKDVAEMLGYGNARKAMIDHVDEEDKGVTKCDTLGGSQKMAIINESGLYSLVLFSKLPGAKRFKRWVTREVLPSIRKHGGYIDRQESLSYAEVLAKAVLLAQSVITEREKLLKELKPKADYAERILQSKSLVSVTQIAKDYGLSGQAFNNLLHNLGIQYNMSGQWLLYTKYQDKGYVHSETIDVTHRDGTVSVRMNTKWTQKGRRFLYEVLKQHDILPMIESEVIL